MACLPKSFTFWISSSAGEKPNDDEHIVFHLKSMSKDEWLAGYYNHTEQRVELRNNLPIYEVFPFCAVDYWMIVPEI